PLGPCRGPPAAPPVGPNNVVTSICGAPYGYPRRAHVPAPWSLSLLHHGVSFSGQNIPMSSQAVGLPSLLLVLTVALMPVQTTRTVNERNTSGRKLLPPPPGLGGKSKHEVPTQRKWTMRTRKSNTMGQTCRINPAQVLTHESAYNLVSPSSTNPTRCIRSR
ncbi:hypothetical protein CSPX01_14059, partial [Colletotrichum filicis]